MEEILTRLKGKIRLVRGNHDRKHMKILEKYCQIERDILEIRVEEWPGSLPLIICHYPMFSWNRKFHGSWSVSGHNHSDFIHDPHALNIAIHLHNFKLLTFEDVKQKIEERQDGS